ncbi:mannitol dehydrogenase family protein [Agrococcus jejuensis]|uniref:Fructuronate reductase n=1 Tax=Agrococcus jejuensis TaxID=399736 RepID=A0A1G8DVQ0_9MICO|nr:mannitol dehydrogenase family protein [Agrococcus jejuensis]SDH61763.1 fructuronate reductase [Agrococcus jejuensis]
MTALTRASARAGAPAPVRIVHLGLGAFHRAHQAWYTAKAEDAGEWGIAAFTGRRPDVADALRPQGGAYTLLERGPDGDAAETIGSIVEVWPGDDVARLRELVAREAVAIVSLTITEPAYRLRADGSADLDDAAVAADVAALAAGTDPSTPLGRLVAALDARRRAGAGPIAVMPCDNMPNAGGNVHAALQAIASAAGLDETAAWIASDVACASSSVDRITPATTDADRAEVARLTGLDDASPVVTEPFRDWVVQGSFPAGRPVWETAGARFVDDVEPFERRKLWLLNGSHSLLAYRGLLAGHATVAEAIADPVLRAEVDAWWGLAGEHLPAGLDLAAYRAALVARFENARIEHRLQQIAAEGVTKLRVRFVPVLLAERERGGDASNGAVAIGAIAAWVALVLDGVQLVDGRRAEVETAMASATPVRDLLALVEPRLAADASIVEAVEIAASEARSGNRLPTVPELA